MMKFKLLKLYIHKSVSGWCPDPDQKFSYYLLNPGYWLLELWTVSVGSENSHKINHLFQILALLNALYIIFR